MVAQEFIAKDSYKLKNLAAHLGAVNPPEAGIYVPVLTRKNLANRYATERVPCCV
jgi:hypothetical protein